MAEDSGTQVPPAGQVHDLIGIGFGPSNIALAIALEEAAASGTVLDALFLERRDRPSWHPGMMLPGARMQITFLKDLVTLRNPRSRYSFVNYLQEQGRLAAFINLQTFFPSRKEMADYIAWAADEVTADVRYGMVVERVTQSDGISSVHVRDSLGNTRVHRARAVVLGTGLVPTLPEGIEEGPRVSHAIGVLPFLEGLPVCEAGPRSFAILGGGQSAAEVAAYLHHLQEAPVVHVIHDRYGLTPSDDSPFANRVFDPEAVGRWHQAPLAERSRLRAIHAGTNYTAVDEALLTELSARVYHESYGGSRRLLIHDTTRTVAVHEDISRVHLDLVDTMTGAPLNLEVDALICATGFREPDPGDLLEGFPIHRDAEGNPLVDRDYRLRLAGDAPAVYLNGGVEATHGFGSSLLSLVSVRAGEILDSLLHERGTGDADASR